MNFVDSPFPLRQGSCKSAPAFVDLRRAASVPPLKPLVLGDLAGLGAAVHVKRAGNHIPSCMDAVFDFAIRGAEAFCKPFSTNIRKESECEQADPPRRWYRLHPEQGDRYFVRPDAGRRGRIPGVSKASTKLDEASEQPEVDLVKSRCKHPLKRIRSLPPELERSIGVAPPVGLESDALKSSCRVCYEKPVEVVILPCRHGVLCESCLRRIKLSRVARKGGCRCPVCRTSIREVVWIYGEAAIPQYGFSVHLD